MPWHAEMKLNNTCVAGTEREPVDSQEREAGVAVQAEGEYPALPGRDLSDNLYICQDWAMILHRPDLLYWPSTDPTLLPKPMSKKLYLPSLLFSVVLKCEVYITVNRCKTKWCPFPGGGGGQPAEETEAVPGARVSEVQTQDPHCQTQCGAGSGQRGISHTERTSRHHPALTICLVLFIWPLSPNNFGSFSGAEQTADTEGPGARHAAQASWVYAGAGVQAPGDDPKGAGRADPDAAPDGAHQPARIQ